MKKVSKSVSDAESRIMENTNIYQYGGFKSKIERDKVKEKLMGASKAEEVLKESPLAETENPE